MSAALLLSCLCLSGSLAYETATDGKFFYSQLNYENGQSYLRIGIGSQNQQTNFLMNSEELTLGVFTSNCTVATIGSQCQVPHPFNSTTDEARSSNSSDLTLEKTFLFNSENGGLVEIDSSGLEIQTIVNLTVPQYNREFSFSGYVFEIVQINAAYSSTIASGFMGLAPYPAIENN